MSLTEEDYNAVANPKGLELVGQAPASVREQATWRCLLCGREHVKTYRTVKYAANGCECFKALTKVDYQQLATNLGIEWLGNTVPTTNKSMTKWRGPSREIVEASYHQLAYGNGKQLRKKLGV